MLIFVRPVWRSNRIWKGCYSTAAKSQLATLRKQTGYSIKNCKKALEIHNNDLEQAVKWLDEEAQKQSWEKAKVLQTRTATQGLIGIQTKNKTVALVEVSCETDFVSKNKIFRDLVKVVASACCVQEKVPSIDSYSQEHLGPDHLSNLNWDGKNLKDHIALATSQLGENIVLRRGLLVHATQDLSLSVAVHPSTTDSETPLIGTYGALTALKLSPSSLLKGDEVDLIGRQLGMHIIGMNPKRIHEEPGKAATQSPPAPKKPEINSVSSDENEEQEHFDSESPQQDFLLGQAYVFSPESTVEDVLKEKGLQVVHFVRFERGETVDV